MLPDADTLFYLGQIYGGDHATSSWGKEYWKFVIISYKGSTYVLEHHESTDNGKNVLLPIVKKLTI